MTDLRKMAKIETHENVTIEYETANVGTRIMAYIIDQIILYGTIIVLALVLITIFWKHIVSLFLLQVGEGLLTAVAIFLVALFVLQNFYFVFFECVTKGKSPGKAAMRLRVVSVTGEPETFIMSIVRNFFRIADELPAGNCLGGILVFFSKRSQRLGDRIANTMVVKDTNVKKFTKLLDEFVEENESKTETDEFEEFESALWKNVDLGNNFADEKEFLGQYMQRRKRYTSKERERYDLFFLNKYCKKLQEMYGDTKYTVPKDEIGVVLEKLNECSADGEAIYSFLSSYAEPAEFPNIDESGVLNEQAEN